MKGKNSPASLNSIDVVLIHAVWPNIHLKENTRKIPAWELNLKVKRVIKENKGCCECDFFCGLPLLCWKKLGNEILLFIFNKIVNRTFMDYITELLLSILLRFEFFSFFICILKKKEDFEWLVKESKRKW